MPFKLSGNTDLMSGIAGQLQSSTDASTDPTFAQVLQHALPGDVVVSGIQTLPASLVPVASAVALLAVCAGPARIALIAAARRTVTA